MNASYIQGVVGEFVYRFSKISNMEKRDLKNIEKLEDFQDILEDYLAYEISHQGFFHYDSNSKYDECDDNEKEWAITVNKIAIDIFGKNINEILRKNAHISITADKNNSVMYVNDGTYPFGIDKKIEIKNPQKDLDMTL